MTFYDVALGSFTWPFGEVKRYGVGFFYPFNHVHVTVGEPIDFSVGPWQILPATSSGRFQTLVNRATWHRMTRRA